MNEDEQAYARLLRRRIGLLPLTALFLLVLLPFFALWCTKPDLLFAGATAWWALLAVLLGLLLFTGCAFYRNVCRELTNPDCRREALRLHALGFLCLAAACAPYCFRVLPALLHNVGPQSSRTVPALIVAKHTGRLCPQALTLELDLGRTRKRYQSCNVDAKAWHAARPGDPVQVRGQSSAHGFAVTGLVFPPGP